MKKNLLSLVTAVVIVLIHSPSTAQSSYNNNQMPVDMYQNSLTPPDVEGKVAAEEVDVTTRQDFSKRFEHANEVTWIKNRNGFVAIYKQAAIFTHVGYKPHGRWLYTIRTYSDEKKAPKEVRALVKSAYYDYNIFHIKEIEVFGNEYITYVFMLKDDQKLITIKIHDGEMNVIDEMTQN